MSGTDTIYSQTPEAPPNSKRLYIKLYLHRRRRTLEQTVG